MTSTTPSPARDFAVEVVERLRAAGHQALWAGGCVRDLLLGRSPGDYDVATDARPEQVRKLFGHRRTLAVGASFGVIIVRGPRDAGTVEVATFRTEGPYADGRRPQHVSYSTPEHDAERRDFTINGMFYDPIEHRVLDFVGGRRDIEQRVIRAIGVPRNRMEEDKLRMLRAVRFAATLDFQLDPETATAVRSMAAELQIVSAERIAEELRKMLVHANRTRALRLIEELDLLPQIVPELFTNDDDLENEREWNLTVDVLGELNEPTFCSSMAALLLTIGQHAPDMPEGLTRKQRQERNPVVKVCRRLKLSNDESQAIAWLVDRRDALRDAERLAGCELKPLLTHRHVEELLDFTGALRRALGESEDDIEFCRDYLESTPREVLDPTVLLTGRDLIARGHRPGPQFQAALTAVRNAQLNEEISTREQALEMALEMLE